MKINAIKNGNGNILITEDSFEMLLSCLDKQKNYIKYLIMLHLIV